MISQVINSLLGIWLMAAPAMLGYDGAARVNDLIVGPLAANFAIIAIWDVCRSVGKVNIVLGGWLLLAPWVLGYADAHAIVNDSLAGLLLAVFGIAAGSPSGRYGGGWASLRKFRSAG